MQILCRPSHILVGPTCQLEEFLKPLASRPTSTSSTTPSPTYQCGALPLTLSINNTTFANISGRGFAIDFDIIDYVFTNISARSFTNEFHVINNNFINISARGFAIDFIIIDNVFANVSARALTLTLTSLAKPSSTFWQGALPSAPT